MIMRDKFKLKDLLNIPNMLSLFRLCLVPVMIVLNLNGHIIPMLGVVALSAVTDVADGKIARRFNLVTDIGKAIDPLADKLTQCALFVCLALSVKYMWAILALFVVKEITMLILNYFVIKKTDKVIGALWYGKVCTVILYASAMVLIIDGEFGFNLPDTAAVCIVALCGVALLFAFIMYVRFYARLLKQK